MDSMIAASHVRFQIQGYHQAVGALKVWSIKWSFKWSSTTIGQPIGSPMVAHPIGSFKARSNLHASTYASC